MFTPTNRQQEVLSRLLLPTNSIPNFPPKPPSFKPHGEYHITELISSIFRNLQLDTDIQSKGLFDLIDYCELLYEQAVTKNDVNEYIKGFLIFNYFINSFVMLHFGGFDKFIEACESDFIIYLNVFHFYNNEESVHSYGQHIDLHRVRDGVLKYLVNKNLLTFNVEDLYLWLNEYIEYLKDKDKDVQLSTSTLGFPKKDLNTSNDSLNDLDTYPEMNGVSLSRQESEDFKTRYPSIKLDSIPNITNNRSITPSSSSQYIQPTSSKTIPSSPVSTLSRREEENRIYSSNIKYHNNEVNGSYTNNLARMDQFDSTVLNALAPYPLNTDILENGIQELNIDQQSEKYNRPPQTVPKSTPLTSPSTITATYDNSFGREPKQGSRSEYLQNMNSTNNGRSNQDIYHENQRSSESKNNNYPRISNRLNNMQQYGRQTEYFSQPYNTYSQVPVQPPSSKVPPLPMPVRKDQRGETSGICGLRNFGSTCYINLSIQILFGIHDLKAIFRNMDYHKYIKDPKYQKLLHHYVVNGNHKDSLLMSDAVSGLLKTFNQNGGSYIAPTKFIRISSILKPDFNIPNEQQDAQEFLLFVLERIHNELSEKIELTDASFYPIIEDYICKWNIEVNPKDKPEYMKWYRTVLEHEGKSPIHDLIQGHLQSKLRCNQCGHESISYSPFTSLSLPIPSSRNQQVNLSDCLRYYTQDEVLSGENAWNCPKCNQNSEPHVSALDSHPVFTPKKSGIFSLGKRSKSPLKETKPKVSKTKTVLTSTKSLTFIKLPQVLFIHLARFSIYNQTNKLETMIQYPLELKFCYQAHEIRYKLSGLINHYGNLKSGHYTALVNKSTINQHLGNNIDTLLNPYWCFFDDESVKPNVIHGNITQRNMDQVFSKDVYVLCYERIS
jgi:ubiquitin carboxyl-terminal hydrolase 7/11